VPLLNTALGGYMRGQRIRRIYKGDQPMIPGRINRATNGSIEVDLSKWGNYASPTAIATTEWAAAGTRSRKITTNAAAEQGHTYIEPAPAVGIAPGDVVTVALTLMRPTTSGTVTVGGRGTYTGTPSVISNGGFGAGGIKTVTLQAGVPQRVVLTFTIPALQASQTALTGIGVQAYLPSTVPIGTVLYADAVMLEKGATDGTFRDGTAPGWGWDGAANASAASGWN
jgi:hypothetical protein